MCGIAGYSGGVTDAGWALTQRMLRSQAHRGPDGAGMAAWTPGGGWTARYTAERGAPAEVEGASCCVLGHNWLAVMDRRPESQQPMLCGSLALVFNGEIYNYIELREELRSSGALFGTASDTEVLLEWWRRYGIGGLQRLRGMFAFAVYDGTAGMLTLVRDPCGIKPLYWAKVEGGLLFSSEMRALHVDGAVRRRMRETAMIASASAGINKFGETATLYDGVFELPPGHCLRQDRDGIRVTHPLPIPALDPGWAGDRGAAELRAKLEQSVAVHLRSSRRIATCVSGGLDSTSIATIIGGNKRLLRDDFRAYTIWSGGAEDYEVDLAKEACVAANVDHRVFEYTGEIAIRDALEMTVAYEVPNHVVGPINQYLLLRHVAEDGVTVVLDGQGGDETLSAYPWYVPVLLNAIERRAGDTSGLRRQLQEHLPFPPDRMEMFGRMFHDAGAWVRTFIWDTDFLGLSHELVDSLEETRYYLQGGGEWPPFRDRMYLRGELQYLLRQEDRLGMWFGLECRVPFVDMPVQRVAARLAPEFLLQDGYLKYPLRVAMPELPASIRWNTRKRGFWDTHPDRFPWMASVSRSVCMGSAGLRRVFPKLEENWVRMSFDQQWRLLQLAVLENCSGKGDAESLATSLAKGVS